ncbi:MAG: cytochrome oxidase [Proteobacteria bacterium]|nr:cytochrome oxidase [Pseudomonadota bacterium]HQR03020.1 cytochrome C oxidase subunit II [Rhodocyclaceae bacterium]
MIPQDEFWMIALAGMGLVAAGFLHVLAQAGKTADEAESSKSQHTAHVLRRWLFVLLLAVFITGSWATLHHFPIPRQNQALEAKQVVSASGRLWSWQIEPATVQAHSPVEFQVTSIDVNHGFAIYSPEGRIVVQTQAMPGYTNRILHTFDQPGTYTVRCLEYCGIGHVPMTAEINVVASRGD